MSEKVSASLSVSIREALPEKYSLRRNLRLMAMTFFRPRSVIEFFGGNTALPYILLPLVAFTALFEVGYVLDYFLKAPGLLHFLGRVLGIPDATYNLYQIFLLPVVNIADFLLYTVVLHAVSRLLRITSLIRQRRHSSSRLSGTPSACHRFSPNTWQCGMDCRFSGSPIRCRQQPKCSM